MAKVLVVVERSRGAVDDSAFELATLGRALAGPGGRVGAALLGSGVAPQASELASWFDDLFVFDAPRLAVPDGMAGAELLAPLVDRERPALTLVPHSNTGMDLAPALAVKAGAPLVADCLRLELGDGQVQAVRSLHGGKVHARVTVRPTERGAIATVRPGSHARAETAPAAAGAVHAMAVEDTARRRRHLETVAAAAGEVDISQAPLLVGVGRGIGEEENLEVLRRLAEALGAELAGTRPVVDKGWLPKSRQVGTSGVSVKPRAYLAFGLSGSFQHMGGIRGGPFVAAVNKDPAAPVFAVADVGIVADLFDIAPLLEKRVRALKG